MKVRRRPPSWSRPERRAQPLLKRAFSAAVLFALQVAGSEHHTASRNLDLEGQQLVDEATTNKYDFTPVFDPERSRTFTRRADGEFSVSYLDGSTVEGLVARDIVQVGGFFAPADFVYVKAGSGLKQRQLLGASREATNENGTSHGSQLQV